MISKDFYSNTRFNYFFTHVYLVKKPEMLNIHFDIFFFFGLFRAGKNGQLILGGSDPSLFEGDMSYIDLIKADWYRIKVDG